MANLKSKYFMKLALLQASHVIGKTKTNPAVGCVIVKNNCLLSAASTSLNGRPHAEHNALKLIKKKTKNLTLYSTLEPCSHYGKTSPCVNKIIKKRIKKVFFSIKDPDIRTYNKSLNIFKKKNIQVSTNVLSNEANQFYKSYIKYKKKGLPLVTCKLAVSKDLFINDKRSKYITNKYSRSRVHLLRNNHDCILSSSATVINDNSLLNCRVPGLEKFSPVRVVLDSKLKIPINSKLIKTAKKYKTIFFYNKINEKKIKILKKKNIKLMRESLNKNGLFDLHNILQRIKNLGLSRVFLECGLKLSLSFFKDKLVDDFYLFTSNKKIGRYGKNNIKNIVNIYIKNKKINHMNINLFGDKLVNYKF